MKLGVKPLGVGVGVLVIGTQLFAAVPEKYQTILDRNPFGLLPPPVVVPETKVNPPSEIKVTGFATIAGSRRVYLAIPAKTAKDVMRFLDLSEGQRDGDIEVLGISEKEGEVRLRNAGIDMALSLQKNGFQSGGGSAPAPISHNPVPRLGVAVNSGVSSSPQPASAIYNPTPVAAAGGVVGGASRPVQALAMGSNAGTTMGNSVIYNNTSPTPLNNNTGSGPAASPSGSPSFFVPNGSHSGDRLPQPKFPAEKTFTSPEEAYIHTEAEKIHAQNTREYWVEYYRKLGWPSDRPLPIDVAAQLSPSQ